MNIYLDYDSTINSFMNPLVEFIQKNIDPNCTLGSIVDYTSPRDLYGDKIVSWWESEESYSRMFPLEGAISFVSRLYRTFDITVVTTTKVENMITVKNKHIDKYFGSYLQNVIHVSHHLDKVDIAKDGILVDDYYKVVEAHVNRNNALGILFNFKGQYPYADNKYNIIHDRFRYATEYHDIERMVYGPNR